MERVENWGPKLARWARAQAGRDLEWGETDCTALAVRALETVWGECPGEPPGWTTRTGALRASRRVNGATGWLVDSPAFREVDPAFAQRGDILVEPAEDWDGVGVLVGYREVLTADPDGDGPVIAPRSEFGDGTRYFRPAEG